jgi:hypothetical protein
VEDLYTGVKRDVQSASGPECKAHYQKGWAYSNEPLIARHIRDGYTFEYGVLSSRLVH